MRVSTRIVAAVAVLILVPATASAYGSYRGVGGAGCFNCHPGFEGRGPTHDLHVGNNQMTATCLLCHTSVGDSPLTTMGGAAGGFSCRGCHGVDNGTTFGWGAGLRQHHLNAGAPPDLNGQRCNDCHTDDPPPSPESTVPVHYLRGDVNISDPCVVAVADGGEDFSGDGKGLDNDGDLAYDGDDSDCGDTAAPEEILAGATLSISPNPAGSRGATIRFELARRADVLVEVFDSAGRLVRRERHDSVAPGPQSFALPARDRGGSPLPAGVYLVRVQDGVATATGRLVLLR